MNSLPSSAPQQAALPFAGTIQDRFEAFHARHPEVYAYLVRLCYEIKAEGVERFGIRTLWENARWNFRRRKDGDEAYAWNDAYTSRYARLIVAQHPDLSGFFELRGLRAQ